MHRIQDLCQPPAHGRRSSAAVRWALAALVPMLVTLVVALTAGPASAQVIRCTDAKTGRVTYTNSSCKDGENRVQVQEAPSPEELERERAQSAAAIERKNQQLTREEAERRARAQQQEREARSRRERENSAQRDSGDSPACQQARRRLDTILAESNPDPATWGPRSQAAQQQMEMACLGPKAYEQLQQSRALQPNAINRPWIVGRPVPPQPLPPSAPISHCNVFRCYDTNGGIHPR
ncbi:DUF4124 domain-containing protein [Delftia sp. K82]|uniref:DUF4124 domain-containing protein n=1 Tax=Delftia TaxID=80865 RepID=UPI000B48A55B|nr:MULTISPECIES: DUF4124 domain-containing protein [Delftia]MBJ2139191.1 DUF4124 domain-containing protein [Delftia acidovorans]OWG12996.1 DUF4124 domain-containing protein [Delftia sp. K82]